MKHGPTGCHIFGIDDNEVVCEIWAEPDEVSEALVVEVRRNVDVPLSTIADIVQGVGRSLWRLANNPATVEILQNDVEVVDIKGEPPF